MNYADKMATSKDPIDRRFINLYIYRKATQKNIRFGLDNDILLNRQRRRVIEDNRLSTPREFNQNVSLKNEKPLSDQQHLVQVKTAKSRDLDKK